MGACSMGGGGWGARGFWGANLLFSDPTPTPTPRAGKISGDGERPLFLPFFGFLCLSCISCPILAVSRSLFRILSSIRKETLPYIRQKSSYSSMITYISPCDSSSLHPSHIALSSTSCSSSSPSPSSWPWPGRSTRGHQGCPCRYRRSLASRRER